MSRSIKLLTVAVLAIVLALSSAQNAFSSQWIIYDTGSSSNPVNEEFVGVRFSLPTDVSSAHVLTVSFYWGAYTSIQGSGMLKSIHPLQSSLVRVHITGSPPGTELITPILIPTLTLVPGTWKDVSVLSSNLVVSGDFYVVIEQPVPSTVWYDTAASNFQDRSHYGDSLDHVTDNNCCGPSYFGNLMIRAEIDPITQGAPVGGFMQPVNKLTVAAPYLALVGIIAAVAVVIWKKREN